MTEQNPAATPAAATDPSVQNPAPVAPTPPAPAPVAVPAAAPSDPAWLPERIARAKTSAETELLAKLGVTDVETAKKAIAAANAAAEANKTAEQRAADAAAQAATLKTQNDAQAAVIAEYAGRQMLALTDEQKAAVKSIAGDDAASQLKAIAALQPTWAKPAPVVTNTAPAPNAPQGATTSPSNARAEYEALQKTNPFAAAAFGAANPDVYRGQGTTQ